jgi:hypothetical protein
LSLREFLIFGVILAGCGFPVMYAYRALLRALFRAFHLRPAGRVVLATVIGLLIGVGLPTLIHALFPETPVCIRNGIRSGVIIGCVGGIVQTTLPFQGTRPGDKE